MLNRGHDEALQGCGVGRQWLRRRRDDPAPAPSPRGGARAGRVDRLRRSTARRRAPEPRGSDGPPLREPAAGRGRARHGRRAARPAPQGRRELRPRGARGGREGGRSLGRFPPEERGRLRSALRREAPLPRAARRGRLRPPGAVSRRDPRREARRLAGLLRDHDRARTAPARQARPARAAAAQRRRRAPTTRRAR